MLCFGWSRYDTRNLTLVRVLVLRKLCYRDIPFTLNRVANDESAVRQLAKKIFDVTLVVRQALSLQAFGAIFHAAFPVRLAPQAGEEDSSQRIALGKKVILEEARLDVAGSAHGAGPSSSRKRAICRSAAASRISFPVCATT